MGFNSGFKGLRISPPELLVSVQCTGRTLAWWTMEATFQRFRNKSPGKIKGYEMVVTVLCDAKTWYVSNIEIYKAQQKKWDETAMLVLENNSAVHHHVYQDNFYKSLMLSENLLQHNISVCVCVCVCVAKRGPTQAFRRIRRRQKSERKDSQSPVTITCHMIVQL